MVNNEKRDEEKGEKKCFLPFTIKPQTRVLTSVSRLPVKLNTTMSTGSPGTNTQATFTTVTTLTLLDCRTDLNSKTNRSVDKCKVLLRELLFTE